MADDTEETTLAVKEALHALSAAYVEKALPGTDAKPSYYVNFLAAALRRDPAAYRQTIAVMGDKEVSVTVDGKVMMALLKAVLTDLDSRPLREFDQQELTRMREMWLRARGAYNNPRETTSSKYQTAALNEMGIHARIKIKDLAWWWVEDLDSLRRGEFYDFEKRVYVGPLTREGAIGYLLERLKNNPPPELKGGITRKRLSDAISAEVDRRKECGENFPDFESGDE